MRLGRWWSGIAMANALGVSRAVWCLATAFALAGLNEVACWGLVFGAWVMGRSRVLAAWCHVRMELGQARVAALNQAAVARHLMRGGDPNYRQPPGRDLADIARDCDEG